MIRLVLTYTLASIFIFSCANEESKKSVESNAKVSFGIDGMTCEINCARFIKNELSKMDGVEKATVDFEKKLATIYYNNEVTNDNAFEEKIESLNNHQYEAEKQKNSSSETIDHSSSNSSSDNNNVVTRSFELPNILDFFTDIL